jgi:uncharacterized protein (TIGR04255 family)
LALSNEPTNNNAPAAEVIFGIATAWEAPPDAKAWEEPLRQGLSSQFTFHEQQVQTHLALQLRPDGVENNGPTGLQVIGHRFKTDDGKVVVHFNTGGLSVHRLAPYGGFETVLPIVEHCWALFLEVTKPMAITRVAMRYINVLQLPKQAGQVLNTDRHFKIPFHSPDPNAFDARGLHVVYELTDKDTKAPVRCAIATLPTTEVLQYWPVALDIEAVLNEQHLVPWQQIEEQLRSLRSCCNRTFDAVLNERPSGASSADQVQ